MTRAVVVLLTWCALLLCLSQVDAGSGEPKRWKRKVPKNSDVVYKIRYFANQDAEFAIIGEGNTDVDIHVLDETGKGAGSDAGYCMLLLDVFDSYGVTQIATDPFHIHAGWAARERYSTTLALKRRMRTRVTFWRPHLSTAPNSSKL